MRHPSTIWLLLVFFAPALAIGQPTDDGSDDDPYGDPKDSFVVLHSGEIIEGAVEVVTVRGAPEHVIVNGTAYPSYQVKTYQIGGDVYGIVQVGDPRPMLVVRQSSGAASVYRNIDQEGVTSDFVQIGDGPIRLATSQHLREAFADHPDAMRHLHRDRFLSYTAVGAVVVGAGLIATGAVIEFADLDGPNGVQLGLSGVGFAALVTAIAAPARSQARRAAIRAYNR